MMLTTRAASIHSSTSRQHSGSSSEHSGDLMKRDAAAIEDVGDLRHRTSSAPREPFAGHRRAIAHLVEVLIIDRRPGLEIENNHRHLCPPHHRQHSGGKRISRNVQENQIHVGLAKLMPGLLRFLRCVDKSEIHDLDTGPSEFAGDLLDITSQTFAQSSELRPVSVQPDTEQSDAQRVYC